MTLKRIEAQSLYDPLNQLGLIMKQGIPRTYIQFTADIVGAFVARNAVPQNELTDLIKTVHKQIEALGNQTSVSSRPAQRQPLKPAVPIKKSVTADHIICLEDGRKLKSLKRHLSTNYGLSPRDYRVKWGLPHDYPMVAANYAELRSKLAKDMGLGIDRRRPARLKVAVQQAAE